MKDSAILKEKSKINLSKVHGLKVRTCIPLDMENHPYKKIIPCQMLIKKKTCVFLDFFHFKSPYLKNGGSHNKTVLKIVKSTLENYRIWSFVKIWARLLLHFLSWEKD